MTTSEYKENDKDKKDYGTDMKIEENSKLSICDKTEVMIMDVRDYGYLKTHLCLLSVVMIR